MIRFLLLLALVSITGDDRRAGRRGNEHYRAERYDEAAAAYRVGIAALEGGNAGRISAALKNNLGSALYRNGDFEGALNAFVESGAAADSPNDASRGSYNAGNAAFRKDSLEEALVQYRRSLLRNPSDEDARFNYEFVKRKLKEQQQEQQQEQDQKQNQDQQDQDQQPNEQEQEQQQQQEQQQDQEQQQEQQELKNPEELSKQEAERILEALENDEEQLLRQVQKMKARPRRVEKDW